VWAAAWVLLVYLKFVKENSMTIRFDNQVAIVTGAGNGLGRSHALALAERGAKVVVNDLGAARDGSGGSSEAALEVVRLIKERGGEAIANGANVAKIDEVEQMVAEAMTAWGRVDMLVNNAGILRDKTFAKMDLKDFDIVMDVHLKGSVNCTKAVWEIMREQEYGRIVMTTSSSGLYGNFGQSNYGAAKMAVVGFMNTLVLEGQKYNIHVNALAPAAATRMTTDLGIDEDALNLMTPEAVTAGLLTLCHKDSPNRLILCAGAGGYASTQIYETDGIYLPPGEQTPEAIMAQLGAVTDSAGQRVFRSGAEQSEKFVKKALEVLV
jgi:NAD(P)-dependent dehydrogenase (short-subunit alcohol dehydrogenase family)